MRALSKADRNNWEKYGGKSCINTSQNSCAFSCGKYVFIKSVRWNVSRLELQCGICKGFYVRSWGLGSEATQYGKLPVLRWNVLPGKGDFLLFRNVGTHLDHHGRGVWKPTLRLWRWRKWAPPKYWCLNNKLHDVWNHAFYRTLRNSARRHGWLFEAISSSSSSSLYYDRSIAPSEWCSPHCGIRRFRFQYPMIWFSSRSSSSCFSLLPLLLVLLFPPITCFSWQFLDKMWQIQLAFVLFVCSMFLFPRLFVILFFHSFGPYNLLFPSPASRFKTFK
jgi:hypothetical protein